ncbi:preprotein translocase subunit YajC [Streptomyces sp. NPDC005438]|uniref:preprotein translocase subunit YajC n=1 Tax=Streptomyces sp. NPDC005438 TaxID=3156880 RepID=UPI0033BE9428
MSIFSLLPFLIIIGAMFLMARSAKNKQKQAMEMRNQMQPGTGIRTIGGMYATVKEVGEDTVLLEIAPGVHAHYAKNAVGAVLEREEYDRIVHGIEPEEKAEGAEDAENSDVVVPDDASSLTDSQDEDRITLDKSADEGDAAEARDAEEDSSTSEPGAKEAKKADDKRADLSKGKGDEDSSSS